MNDLGSELHPTVPTDVILINSESKKNLKLEEGYLRILGSSEIPSSPDQMPDTVTLPSDAISVKIEHPLLG